MMLMNSTARVLVGEKYEGRLIWNNLELKPYGGCVVCAPGGRVGEVGAAELIESGC